MDDQESITTRVADALNLATRLHQGQVRKGTTIPYVSHLLHVAAYVTEDGGSEDVVIAALLHDAAEDQGGRAILLEIASRFGDHVARIVEDCSDSLLEDRQHKAPWLERKQAVLSALASMHPDSLLVIAADKLHNVEATRNDLRLGQGDVWDRFKTGKEGFIWYHEEVLRILSEVLPGSRSVSLLRAALTEVR